ncbi:MAG: MFS transporter [Deltaproteobacteria bacterium]|nr:MFS transporter [Deltaproteobacteria bacterium]
MVKQKRLFVASCLALIATSMAFSIRADIIPALKVDFSFTDTQMGVVAGPGLWGFAITIVLGGMLVDVLGMGTLMALAFVGHVAGVLLTIFATGFQSLYFATLLIGLANGTVEAVINPLTATLYSDSKTKHLNMLHAWWPGGLIVGGLMGYGITKIMGLDAPDVTVAVLSMGWKIKMALILVPTLIYGFLLFGQPFPKTERVAAGVSNKEMFSQALHPLFILFAVLMMMTAAAELGPDQWVGNLLQKLVGIQGVLLLVYTAGIMFVLRHFFSGPLIQKMNPLGVLVFASLLTALGLYWLSFSTSAFMVLLAATIFGIGKTYFWPTMLGVVAERFPKGGALLLGLMGGAGMFSVGWLATPIMGAIQDHYAVQALSPEVQERVVSHGGIDERKVMEVKEPAVRQEIEQAEQHSAAMTYRWISLVPAILTIVFFLLFFSFRQRGGYQVIHLEKNNRV